MRDALTGWNFFQSINRLTVFSEISGIRYLLITLNNFTPLLLLSEKRWKETFLLERCFPFVTIYYHDFFSFTRRNIVQIAQLILVNYTDFREYGTLGY